jgi:hypothetical protein
VRELYNLHTPFVIAVLAFVVVFVFANRNSERKR